MVQIVTLKLDAIVAKLKYPTNFHPIYSFAFASHVVTNSPDLNLNFTIFHWWVADKACSNQAKLEANQLPIIYKEKFYNDHRSNIEPLRHPIHPLNHKVESSRNSRPDHRLQQSLSSRSISTPIPIEKLC